MEIITCKNCYKKYKNEKAYEKHRLLCLDDEDNFEDRPIKEILIRVIADNRKLKHDVNELKRWEEIALLIENIDQLPLDGWSWVCISKKYKMS